MQFKVDDTISEERKITLLRIHLVYRQSQLNSTATKPEKVKQPNISVGSSIEDWIYFQSRWNTYKSATKLSGQYIIVQMLSSFCQTGGARAVIKMLQPIVMIANKN